jgi:hypothetical protein
MTAATLPGLVEFDENTRAMLWTLSGTKQPFKTRKAVLTRSGAMTPTAASVWLWIDGGADDLGGYLNKVCPVVRAFIRGILTHIHSDSVSVAVTEALQSRAERIASATATWQHDRIDMIVARTARKALPELAARAQATDDIIAMLKSLPASASRQDVALAAGCLDEAGIGTPAKLGSAGAAFIANLSDSHVNLADAAGGVYATAAGYRSIGGQDIAPMVAAIAELVDAICAVGS